MEAHKILVVDDSPTDLHLLTGYLVNNGYTPVTAVNGEEAIAKAMNGYEATRVLSRNPATARIPVLMVSSKDQEIDKIWGMRQGAKDYLAKPVDEHTLIGKIRSL
jgi:twitching motility two-component system response regulator PilH